MKYFAVFWIKVSSIVKTWNIMLISYLCHILDGVGNNFKRTCWKPMQCSIKILLNHLLHKGTLRNSINDKQFTKLWSKRFFLPENSLLSSLRFFNYTFQQWELEQLYIVCVVAASASVYITQRRFAM